jgi:cytochrome c6
MTSSNSVLNIIRIVLVLVVLGWFIIPGRPRPAQAMPTFSQGLGVSCQTCHTMVPALNSYGAYILRSFYQPINTKQTRSVSPIWIWEEISSTSTGAGDSKQPSKTIAIGNAMVYFAGFAGPEITYRLENAVFRGDQAVNQSKGPETAWIAYNGLFHGYGHLLMGNDYPGPTPAFLANPSDYSNFFQIRHLQEGTHSYNLINDRLTARFDYEKGPIDAQIAFRGNNTSWIAGGPSTFTGVGLDKAYQWVAGYAPPTKKFQAGLFGIDGSFALRGAPGTYQGPPNVDHYDLWSPYVDLDPGWIKGVPGFYAFDASSHDSNPGLMGYTGQGPKATDESFEVLQPFSDSHYMYTVRQETINDGLGNFTRFWGTGISAEPFKTLPYIFMRFQVPMAGYSSAPNGKPTWEWALQFLTPVSGPFINPFNRRESSNATPAPTASAVSDGATIYGANCEACHGANGQGGAFPALAGSAKVTASDPTALISLVKDGSGVMPGYGMKLSDADIAAVLTYVRSSWGNNASAVTADQVSAIK